MLLFRENIGFPVVECASDGQFAVSKPPNTGGLVSWGTVAEQVTIIQHSTVWCSSVCVCTYVWLSSVCYSIYCTYILYVWCSNVWFSSVRCYIMCTVCVVLYAVHVFFFSWCMRLATPQTIFCQMLAATFPKSPWKKSLVQYVQSYHWYIQYVHTYVLYYHTTGTVCISYTLPSIHFYNYIHMCNIIH